MIRIAATGDLHFGEDSAGTLRPHLEHLAEQADVLLLAGDLTKLGRPEEAAVLAAEFGDAPVPVIGVLGNHDHQSNRPQEVRAVLEEAGVRMLEGESTTLELDGSSLGSHDGFNNWLGEIVFADPGLLAKLNAIVHPLVAERMLEIERAVPPGAVVVHDVPLLAENQLSGRYDVVVVVDVPDGVQLGRLTRLRGMPPDQARARLAAQASREQRLAVADIVVDNSGPLAGLDRRVDRLWEELCRRRR